jgi:hypothetical protein
MIATLKVLVPEATTNYVQNPSLRYDTTGWNAVGSTITRVLNYCLYGISSLKVVTNGLASREGVYYLVSDLTGISEPITISAYVRGSGTVQLRLIEGLGKEWISSPTSMYPDRWTRMEVSGYSTGNNDMRLYVETIDGTPKAITFYVDGAQMERKAYATTYADGDQPGCRWNIMDSSSNSTREEGTRQGGRWVELTGPDKASDDIYVTLISGMGMPPIQNNVQSWAFSPGSFFQNSKILDRVVTMTFHAKNEKLRITRNPDSSPLHRLRQQLIDIFKPDLTGGNEPFLFSFQDGERELFLNMRYEAGLDGSWDIRNQWVDSMPLRFLVVDPIFTENNFDSTQIDFQDSKVINGILGRINGRWDWMNGGVYAVIGDGGINNMAMSPRGILYAAGIMTTMNEGVTANPCSGKIIYWDGSRWNLLSAGATDAAIEAITVAPNGDIYATGYFTTICGVAANRVAKWNGTAWSALGTGLNNPGYCVRVAPNGDVYVGGNFTQAGGLTRNYIARWDGGSWQSIGALNGLNGAVYSMEITPDGSLIYIGGNFTDQFGLAANALLRVATYSPSSNTFSAMSPGFATVVKKIALSPQGIVYAGGDFTLSGSTTVNYIARWNGSAWVPLGSGMNSHVNEISISPTGELAAGGEFSTAGGVECRLVALWNGSSWSNFDVALPVGYGYIRSVLFASNGDLFVAGLYLGHLNDVPFPPPFITYYAGITTVINSGTAESKPSVYIYGSGKLRWIENQTTKKRMYLNLDILPGEEVVIDFGKGEIKSTVRGNLSYSILPGSNFSDFTLIPGANTISTLMYNDVGSVIYMYNRPQHWSASATVNAEALP